MVFGHLGQVFPLFVGKTHDAVNQTAVGVMLFQIEKLHQIVFQRAVGDLFNILNCRHFPGTHGHTVHPGRGMIDAETV